MAKKDVFLRFKKSKNAWTKNKLKPIEKRIITTILDDQQFQDQVLTIHHFKSNSEKVKKIVKLMIYNLYLSYKNNSDLVITLDNSLLSDNGISVKIYKGVILELVKLDYVKLSKGYFNQINQIHRRTSLTVSESLKNMYDRQFVNLSTESKINRFQPSLVEDKAVQVQPKAEIANSAQNGLKTQLNTIQDEDKIIHISNAELTPINNNGKIKIKIKNKQNGDEKYVILDKENKKDMEMLNIVLNCQYYHITNDYKVQYQGDTLLDIYSNYTEQLIQKVTNGK